MKGYLVLKKKNKQQNPKKPQHVRARQILH